MNLPSVKINIVSNFSDAIFLGQVGLPAFWCLFAAGITLPNFTGWKNKRCFKIVAKVWVGSCRFKHTIHYFVLFNESLYTKPEITKKVTLDF